MYARNGKRFDVAAPHVIDGESFGSGAFFDPKVRARFGVELIDEPAPPEDYSELTHEKREIDDAPYVTYKRKSDEQITELMLAKAKAVRAHAVANIIVTTTSGKTFDGHEAAQERMSRAARILHMLNAKLAAGESVTLPEGFDITYAIVDGEYHTLWVLADNTPAMIDVRELEEALLLAAAKQGELWVKPYLA